MQSTVKIIRFVPKSFFVRARPLWPSRRCTFMFFRTSSSLCNCAYICFAFVWVLGACLRPSERPSRPANWYVYLQLCVFGNKDLLRASMYSSLCLCGISGGSGMRWLLSNTKWPWKRLHIRYALCKLFEQVWMRVEFSCFVAMAPNYTNKSLAAKLSVWVDWWKKNANERDGARVECGRSK